VPEIAEYIPGMRLDRESRLGINTQLGSSGEGYNFTVTLELEESSEVNINTVKAIIEAQKPAHIAYTLQIRRNGRRQPDNGT